MGEEDNIIVDLENINFGGYKLSILVDKNTKVGDIFHCTF